MRMLQSESLDGYNWELAAIFKRRRRHGFALFHQGDDGSRWTSASEFRKSTELLDVHIRRDGRRSIREKLVGAFHWINHKLRWMLVPKLPRVYSNAVLRTIQRMKKEPMVWILYSYLMQIGIPIHNDIVKVENCFATYCSMQMSILNNFYFCNEANRNHDQH